MKRETLKILKLYRKIKTKMKQKFNFFFFCNIKHKILINLKKNKEFNINESCINNEINYKFSLWRKMRNEILPYIYIYPFSYFSK